MLVPGTLEAFGLYLVRTSAMVLAAPIIGTGASFSGYKIALSFLVSVVLFVASGGPLEVPVETFEYGMFVLREVMIGLFFAFALQITVLAARVAGDLIGLEMGFNMSNMVDPVSGVSTPLIASMYEMLFFLGILALNGHHWLFRALSDSYARAPVGEVSFDDGLVGVVVKMFSELFAAGITLAAPILVLLALVSLLIGLLSRTVPQLNVMEFGFNLRIVVGLIAMLIFTPLLAPAMGYLLEELMVGLDAGLEVLGA